MVQVLAIPKRWQSWKPVSLLSPESSIRKWLAYESNEVRCLLVSFSILCSNAWQKKLKLSLHHPALICDFKPKFPAQPSQMRYRSMSYESKYSTHLFRYPWHLAGSARVFFQEISQDIFTSSPCFDIHAGLYENNLPSCLRASPIPHQIFMHDWGKS